MGKATAEIIKGMKLYGEFPYRGLYLNAFTDTVTASVTVMLVSSCWCFHFSMVVAKERPPRGTK